MSISAMKQALEALERGRSQIIGALVQQDQDEAITALRQAIKQAEKQEPVVGTKTWFEDGKMVTQHLYASDISQEPVDETAKDRHISYVCPNCHWSLDRQECGHCCPEREWENVTDDALIEEVRRRGFTIRDAQISPKIKDEYELCCQKYDTCTEPCTPRGKHLAKREWVGLTDEERSYYLQSAHNVGWWQAAKFVEAKLKEKNA